jgi:hypothetical protein
VAGFEEEVVAEKVVRAHTTTPLEALASVDTRLREFTGNPTAAAAAGF